MIKRDSNINVNTILISILTVLSGWTLKTVVELSVSTAVIVQKVSEHDEAIKELKKDEDQLQQDFNEQLINKGRRQTAGAASLNLVPKKLGPFLP